MKPTQGLVSAEGVVPISSDFDSPGPIARSASDIAVMMDAMVNHKSADKIPYGTYTSKLSGSFDGIRIGVLDPTKWHLNDGMGPPSKVFDDQVVSSNRTEMAFTGC
jgi:amidase